MKYEFNTSLFIYDGDDEHELKVHLKADVTFASPEVHTLPNGDPGYPGDEGGIEVYSITSENPLFVEDKLSKDAKQDLENKFIDYLSEE